MTPQELRASILQQAIQGKLVEQRPEEGTGEELFQQIQAEKQTLIKAKKIKKENPLPKIADDDILFDIPETWRWCYVGDLFNHNTGKAMNASAKKSDKPGSVRKFITTSNLYWDSFDFTTVKEMFFTDDEISRCSATKNDILICEGGAYYGRTAIWTYDYDICFQNHVHRLRAYKPLVEKYFYYIFRFYRETGKMQAKGTAMPGLSSIALHTLIIPLPPYAEQTRIVSKLEEILPLIDRYEAAWNKLEEFNKRFPGDMQKSILQLAIQGKLVEQRPEEGTGKELFQQIQAAKQEQIKAGKIKKEKSLPKITADLIPFDIPEMWTWVHLLDVIEQKPSNGYSPKAVDYVTNIRNLTLTATSSGTFKSDAYKYVDIEQEEAAKYWLKPGDILVQRSNSRELVGTSCVYTGEDNAYIFPDLMMRMRVVDGVDVKYVDYVLKSPLTRSYYMMNASGTSESMPKINQSIVSQTLIPLPPLAEQKRIVAKLEEILPLCERLK